MMKFFYGLFSFYGSFAMFTFTNVNSQEICAGDIDSNNIVDVNDLLGVLSRFSETGDLIEDIDHNEIVDVNDILLTLSNYGVNCNNDEITCNFNEDCGGQIWTECGTSCPLICSEPEPIMCNEMCNVGYQCPSNMWWDNETKECVDRNNCLIQLPPNIAIGRPYIVGNKNSFSKSINTVNDWNKFSS